MISSPLPTGQGILYLNFSQPLNLTALTMSAITLASDASLVPTSYTHILSTNPAEGLLQSYLGQMAIQLNQNDTDAMKKRPPFCSSYRNCYLTMTR